MKVGIRFLKKSYRYSDILSLVFCYRIWWTFREILLKMVSYVIGLFFFFTLEHIHFPQLSLITWISFPWRSHLRLNLSPFMFCQGSKGPNNLNCWNKSEKKTVLNSSNSSSHPWGPSAREFKAQAAASNNGGKIRRVNINFTEKGNQNNKKLYRREALCDLQPSHPWKFEDNFSSTWLGKSEKTKNVKSLLTSDKSDMRKCWYTINFIPIFYEVFFYFSSLPNSCSYDMPNGSFSHHFFLSLLLQSRTSLTLVVMDSH